MREAPQSEQTRAELTRALEHRSSAIVAHAARIAGEIESVALVPALAEAFGRLMVNPSKRDPGCIGKQEIANALYLIGPRDPGVFLSGIRHVQIEGPGDVAADLRGICAHGLVRIGYSDALEELAELLVDPEASARRAAVRALAYRGHESAGPVLRLKLKLGDSDAEIVSDALVALLKLGGDSALAFARRFLKDPSTYLAESVALALGSERVPAALEILQHLLRGARDSELRQTIMTSIANLRDDESIDFLMDLIREAPGPSAREAIRALGAFRENPALAQRVQQVALSRDELALAEAVKAEFPDLPFSNSR